MPADNKYVLDVNPETRALLDLIRVHANERLKKLAVDLEEANKRLSTALVVKGDSHHCELVHAERDVAHLIKAMETIKLSLSNPELGAVEVGARQLAAIICQQSCGGPLGSMPTLSTYQPGTY